MQLTCFQKGVIDSMEQEEVAKDLSDNQVFIRLIIACGLLVVLYNIYQYSPSPPKEKCSIRRNS